MLPQNKTYQKVLSTLADGEFHSGERLGKELGLTRSAIWKAVTQLKELGINIQSITRKGYRIQGGIDLLDATTIEQQLTDHNRQQLHALSVLERVDSTNDYLLERIKQNPNTVLACFAEYQANGRGRRGHQWLSPFGNNIYHSLLWQFNKDPGQIFGLSLAISVAVTRALVHYGLDRTQLQVKWPNDIYYAGKKLGGVLIEMQAESNDHCSVVIGVGLNTHLNRRQQEYLNNQCTSIYDITQTPVKRNQLAGQLLDELMNLLQEYNISGLRPLLTEWSQYDCYTGKPIQLIMGQDKHVEGIMQGVSDKGEVIIRDGKGQLKHYCSGEVSLRPLKQAALA